MGCGHALPSLTVCRSTHRTRQKAAAATLLGGESGSKWGILGRLQQPRAQQRIASLPSGYAGSFYSQEADGKRNYASQQFPLHFISLDTKPQSRFPLAFAYQGSYYGTAKIWVCER